MDTRKNNINEIINSRTADRLIESNMKKDEAAGDKQNYITEFLNKFKFEKSKFLDTLDACKSRDDFDNALKLITDMQCKLTDSIAFLPKYDIWTSQKILDTFKKDLIAKRDVVAPRKVFSFKSKKSGTKAKTKEPVIDTSKASNLAKYYEEEVGLRDIKNRNDLIIEFNDRDISLVNLENCNVKITGTPASVHMINIRNCQIVCGPVNTSVMVEDCKDSVLAMTCQQMRIHSTFETTIYIHVGAKAIIEDSKQLYFAPFTPEQCDNANFEEISLAYRESTLYKDTRNNWEDVDDFNWLSKSVHSPNWSTLEESKRIKEFLSK